MNKEKILIIMMEECGELTQACSKVLRHGDAHQKHLQNLHEELGDVVAMTRLLQEHYDISDETLEVYIAKRNLKMKGAEYK
jgi:NTP pyrophosphatase (non-canonical NTP hydrolase)|tara:strand:- start:1292 stop:1534 length:243 start_codon:yes stop_codon:yes gene_type:complete